METEIERVTIRTSVDGQVLQVKIRGGEFAQAGALQTPLILLGNVDWLHVRVDIDENNTWRIHSDAPAIARNGSIHVDCRSFMASSPAICQCTLASRRMSSPPPLPSRPLYWSNTCHSGLGPPPGGGNHDAIFSHDGPAARWHGGLQRRAKLSVAGFVRARHRDRSWEMASPTNEQPCYTAAHD
jgi:hypothetical protein